MKNKIILGLVFAVTFSMFISSSHSAYAGINCNQHSHYVPNEQFGCVCDKGYVQNGVGGQFESEPICIPSSVGGMGIPVDSTALLLAGVQGSALWMIPAMVVAGAGMGFISYIKSKKKQD